MPYDKLLLSIFLFFTNKARDTAADRLENGDVGNDVFRKLIIRDLHDIKSMLNNLSKIDLSSSLNFLKEGFRLLFNCIDEVESDRECEEASNNDESQATCTAITTRYDLSRAIQHSKVFEMAKDRFKKSREKATDAFNNKNLNLEDRIFAVIFKMMAQIFECPEHQEIVIGLCVSYIEELHEMDSVRQMFSVSIGGGMRSMFKKSERIENIKSVILLNHHLYQFIARINKNHDHLSTWPSIELGDGKMFNPIQDRRKEFPVESWDKNLNESSQEMDKMKTMMFELLDKMTINEHVKTLPSNSGKEDILVVGGGGSSKSMETLNLLSFTWSNEELSGHECLDDVTVVYKQQILRIGGVIDGKKLDLISEMKDTDTTSDVLKELCHMPEPRSCHGAVVVDDKVLIFGGYGEDKILSSVLEFDPRTLTFKKMPPLPHPLCEMATVQWTDQVLLLGGCDDREKVLKSVIMYDCNLGKIRVLPSMLEKRKGCSADITGDRIVVKGGMNDKNEYLDIKSECFEMGSTSWTYLPRTISESPPECEPFDEFLPLEYNCV